MQSKELEIRTLSSLAKVFPERIYGKAQRSAHSFLGAELSFQIALRMNSDAHTKTDYEVRVISRLNNITLYKVGLVPSVFPAYPSKENKDYITTQGGIFPDPLLPLEKNIFRAASYKWRSLWVSVKIPETATPGSYAIKLEFYKDGKKMGESRFNITVHSVKLPKSNFLYTNWFHCDCIADVHGVKIFSEKHWSLIEEYMSLAAQHGMNMILTPVLTPPLDTEVGAERPTVQLVEVEKAGGVYHFDFSRLKRYIEIAKKYGIEHFEINHFFTQWGAEFTPKVVAKVEGKIKKIFGWHTPALSADYTDFLSALIPSLTSFFESMGIPRENLYFHVSDEPYANHLEHYQKVSSLMKPLIEGCRQLDALSSYAFYERGLVETPVVATNHIIPFIEADVDNLWCYYCCSQHQNVSNRFFAMPQERNRIIGVQMYKFGIKGFLHWGYNFYYTYLSRRVVNPYLETDAGEIYPSGDAFCVYPHKNGAIPSLRLKVFSEALSDMRLLSLLEKKIGKEKVEKELDRLMGESITFETSSPKANFFNELYDMIFSYLDN